MTPAKPRRAARLLLALAAALPVAAGAVEPALHAEATVGFDTNPLREAGGEQGVYPFLGVILDAGMAHGGDTTRLSASLSEGARLYPTAGDADVLATRLELDGAWRAAERLDLGAGVELRDLSERGGVRSETGGALRLNARFALARFDVEAGGGLSALYPRTSRLEDFQSIGPDATVGIGFSPHARHRARIAWELHARTFPSWVGSREDVANALVAELTLRGTLIAAVGYSFTNNRSSIDGGSYRRHRAWIRGAVALPWEVTLAAQGSLQQSNYPDGIVAEAERLLSENDERENALELRFSRPLGRDVEAVLKLAAYGGEFSAGDGDARLSYRREVIQLSIGWRPE